MADQKTQTVEPNKTDAHEPPPRGSVSMLRFFGRWICSQHPLTAVVGDPCRSA